MNAPDDESMGSWYPVPVEAELPDGLRGLFVKARRPRREAHRAPAGDDPREYSA